MGHKDLEAQLPMLRRISRRYALLSGWAVDAEELLHEAVLDILEHLERFDPSRGSFTAFCRVWGLHGVREAVASRCRHLKCITSGDPDAFAMAALEIEEALDLAYALEQLSESSRRVIILRCANAMRQREIAEELGLSRSSVERIERQAILEIDTASRAKTPSKP